MEKKMNIWPISDNRLSLGLIMAYNPAKKSRAR
jgi:hypothetical protein